MAWLPGPVSCPRFFTLLEMLVVISIITLLFGIGFGSLQMLSDQMEGVFTASDAKQLISSTIQEARRNQMPMVVKFMVGKDLNGEGSSSYTMTGCQNSLVGYWNFDNQQVRHKGINRIDLLPFNTSLISNGILGQCVKLNGGTILSTTSSERLNCDSDFYFECRIKPNLYNIAAGAATIYNGGNGKMVLDIRKKPGQKYPYLEATGLSGNAQNVPFPEDGQWHKIGLSKMEDIGTFLYLDDILIGYVNNSSSSGTSGHTVQLGEDFKGCIDEVKFYKLGEGQTLAMKGNGIYFGFEAYNSTIAQVDRMYTLRISPLGMVNGIYRESNPDPIFRGNSYVHLLTDYRCTVNLGGTAIAKDGTGIVLKRDLHFPDQGYAWVKDFSNGSALEIVQYELYSENGVHKFRIRETARLGTASSNSASSPDAILQYVEPITITRTGAVL